MVWMMDTICNYGEGVQEEENVEKITATLKENRLLYELGEITKEEYEVTQKDMTKERKFWKRRNGTRARDLLNEK